MIQKFQVSSDKFILNIDSTIDYLSKQDIGVVISQGLAETYKSKPKNPVDFFGKWLLHRNEVEQAKKKIDNNSSHIQELLSHYDRKLKIDAREEKELQDGETVKSNKQSQFMKKVEDCDDHEDILQDLADHIQEYTNSTSVYVAKLVQQKNEIEEDDDNTAHIIDQAPLHLDLYHASPKGFEFLLRKSIKSNEGVVHDVFKVEEPAPEQEQENPPTTNEGEGEGDEHEVEPPKPQSLTVDEVVREPRIKFFKVPRLGSLLCVRLNYESCLFEQALDEAILDVYEVEDKSRQQEIEKNMWEEQENKRREEAEKTEQEYEEEPKEWEHIKNKKFNSETVEYAVCLDTLGQDRKFQQSEIDLSIETIANFAKMWEKQEQKNLKKDIDRRVEKSQEDKDFVEKAKVKFDEIWEKWLDQNTPESEEPKDEQVKIDERKLLLFTFKKKILNSEKIEIRPESPPETKETKRGGRSKREQKHDESKDESKDIQDEEEVDYTEKWKKDIFELKNYRVIKMPRIFQAMFYLLKYSREEIWEENTNMLEWKKAKNLINDELFKKINEYNPIGPKTEEYKKYQKMSFISKLVEEVSQEEVDNYSLALGEILKFIKLAIAIRKNDVASRFSNHQRLVEERETAIEQENERLNERQVWVDEERAKWDAEHQKPEEDKKEAEDDDEGDKEAEGEGEAEHKFDEADAITRFDADNKPIVVPSEIDSADITDTLNE